MPWYPASVTKIMTAYVTLKAVKDGRLTLDTLLTVSPVAASQSPSKMGFRPGIQVTVDNALKMMMVKSANDMAVVLRRRRRRIGRRFLCDDEPDRAEAGMTQTSYVNPNGLPADGQITSARISHPGARVIRDLPEYDTHAHSLDPLRAQGDAEFQQADRALPGADGSRPASSALPATIWSPPPRVTEAADRRRARRVLRASGAVRAAQFAGARLGGSGLGWLKPALGTVDSPGSDRCDTPNLRDEMCNGKRKRPATDEDADVVAANGSASTGETAVTFFNRPGCSRRWASPRT